jgi:DIS3-like exonuclease 2
MNNTKLAFKLDEQGNPVDTKQYITKEANHMIEEFMLLANMRVAEVRYVLFQHLTIMQRICSSKFGFPDCALLRNHPAPNSRKIQVTKPSFPA